ATDRRDRHGKPNAVRDQLHGREGREADPAHPPSLPERSDRASHLRTPRESGGGRKSRPTADASRLALADADPDRAGERRPARRRAVDPQPAGRRPRGPRRHLRHPREENPYRGERLGAVHRSDRTKRGRERQDQRPRTRDDETGRDDGRRPPFADRLGDEGPPVPTAGGAEILEHAPDLSRVKPSRYRVREPGP